LSVGGRGLRADQLYALVASPFIGSFVGVLIRRLPSGKPVVIGRSACETCGIVLAPRDLVPILSYVFAAGRCRQCGAAIGRFHLAVELVAILIAVLSIVVVAPAASWCGCLLGWALLALGWIDWNWGILPDRLTLPMVLAGLGSVLWLQPELMADHAAAAAGGYIAFRGISQVYRKLRHREGLGQGDAKLMAAAGAWVGLTALPEVLLWGAAVTLVGALVSRLAGHSITATTRIPLGPGLCVALWLVWLYEHAL
jgi:leader peptidase (prepilin peptidase)/N-methyltransferase